MKSFSCSWSARSSPRSPARLQRPSRSRRRATTRSAPRPESDWLVVVEEPAAPGQPVRPLRPARERPRFQGQPQGHPGLRRRDRRDEAPLPADPRPVREPVRPQALRPPDEAAEDAPRRESTRRTGSAAGRSPATGSSSAEGAPTAPRGSGSSSATSSPASSARSTACATATASSAPGRSTGTTRCGPAATRIRNAPSTATT